MNGPEAIYMEKESSSGLDFIEGEVVNKGSCLIIFNIGMRRIIADYIPPESQSPRTSQLHHSAP